MTKHKIFIARSYLDVDTLNSVVVMTKIWEKMSHKTATSVAK